MEKKYLVLKPNGPMRLANSSFKIKQGDVALHPGYPVDLEILEEFTDIKKAQAAAERNVLGFNEKVRHGITSMKSIAQQKASMAKDGPTEAQREDAIKNAKILTPTGVIDPAQQIAELQEENEMLRKKAGIKVDAAAYLDQKADTVVKRVKAAAGKGQIQKEHVQEIIQAEQKGKNRKNVLERLKDLAKNDAVFGKLFK